MIALGRTADEVAACLRGGSPETRPSSERAERRLQEEELLVAQDARNRAEASSLEGRSASLRQFFFFCLVRLKKLIQFLFSAV